MTDPIRRIIETDRLICEPVQAAHASEMFKVLSDAAIYQFIADPPPVSVEALAARYAFLSGGKSKDGREHWLNWVLFVRASRQAIGYFQASVAADSCSIAYVLGSEHWGKGYASEAGRSILAHLVSEHGVHLFRAEIHADNDRSQRLAERLGLGPARQSGSNGDLVFQMRDRS